MEVPMSLRSRLRSDQTIVLPAAHDAISARMIEQAGFEAYAISGASVSCTSLALPDLGLQSFGEYRDTVATILSASSLPVLLDGENGFGDAKAVARTVKTFGAMGAGAIVIEDLSFPPTLGKPASVIAEDVMTIKLEAAMRARTVPDMMIVGRTDAAGILGLDEALRRASLFERIGVDGMLMTGIPDLESMKIARDRIRVPMVAIIVNGIPWATPTLEQLTAMGYEMALYPASVLFGSLGGIRAALARLKFGSVEQGDGELSHDDLGRLLRVADWAAIDALAAREPETAGPRFSMQAQHATAP